MADDELDARLADPGFTPSVKSVGGLVDRIARAPEDVAKAATLALGRVQGQAAVRVARAMETFSASERRKVVAALAQRVGRGEDEAVLQLCHAMIRDPDAGVRIASSRVLAKLGGERASDVVGAALDACEDARERVALLKALAKLGGERAARALAANATSEPSLVKARLIAQRTALREASTSAVRLDIEPARSHRMVLVCRRGLEEIARSELAQRAPFARDALVGAGRVTFQQAAGTLEALAGVRCALGFGFGFTIARAPQEDDATCIARAIATTEIADVLRRYTSGAIRYRLAWAEGGKRRSVTWKIAELVGASAPDLVNDPTESAWEIVASIAGDRVDLDVFPKVADARFAYRVGDVPAASHPTIAAALSQVAGVAEDDVVWDPFVGSGLELCERARLGPYRQLVGTDLDERALRTAEANLRSAGAHDVRLMRQDAREARVQGLSSVITNPPMGRRVSPDVDLGRVLSDVIASAARMLRPGGRIVLLSPHPLTTQRAADRAGLTQTLDRRVDMIGFDAVLQRFER